MARLLCTCGKSYEVRSRPAGSKVRCPACQAVLTVPEPRAVGAAVRTASERLRRARGEPCAHHPRALATDACERCSRWMCPQCRAKAPSSHLCVECAPAVGATQAIPLDFGLLATPFVALRLAVRALPSVFAFNLLASASKWLIAIPFIIGIVLTIGMIGRPSEAGTADVILLYSLVAALVVSNGLFDLVLIPAADLLILDRTLREEKPGPFASTLLAAFKRAWSRKGSLALSYLLLLVAWLGSLLVCLPFILAWQITDDENIRDLGFLLTIPASGAVLGAFGLAIPAVILEHRSATQAFGRAWNLARLRPLAASAFGTFFALVFVFSIYHADDLQRRFGYAGLALSLAITFLADIAWPAILVAAYHGLVAEEAKLIGRRS